MQRQTFVSVLSLFTSAGTLLCCALPALLVTLGLGAVMAGLVSNVPQIIWVSEHKTFVFGVAAAMLVVAGVANYVGNSMSCPTDPIQADACRTTRKWSKRIYFASVAIFLVGAAFAFVPEVLG